jgi:hypothetical protein
MLNFRNFSKIFACSCLLIMLNNSNIFAIPNTKVGACLSPGFSISKLDSKFNLDSIGLFFEYYLFNNLSLGSGAMYGWKSLYLNNYFKLGYLQIPFMVTIYSNEIFLDLRLLFTTGWVFSLKVEEEESKDDIVTKNFRKMDFPFYFAVGAQYEIAAFTTVFANIFWKKGIVNLLLNDSHSIKSNFIGLELGIKV